MWKSTNTNRLALPLGQRRFLRSPHAFPLRKLNYSLGLEERRYTARRESVGFVSVNAGTVPSSLGLKWNLGFKNFHLSMEVNNARCYGQQKTLLTLSYSKPPLCDFYLQSNGLRWNTYWIVGNFLLHYRSAISISLHIVNGVFFETANANAILGDAVTSILRSSCRVLSDRVATQWFFTECRNYVQLSASSGIREKLVFKVLYLDSFTASGTGLTTSSQQKSVESSKDAKSFGRLICFIKYEETVLVFCAICRSVFPLGTSLFHLLSKKRQKSLFFTGSSAFGRRNMQWTCAFVVRCSGAPYIKVCASFFFCQFRPRKCRSNRASKALSRSRISSAEDGRLNIKVPKRSQSCPTNRSVYACLNSTRVEDNPHWLNSASKKSLCISLLLIIVGSPPSNGGSTELYRIREPPLCAVL